jgi:anti-sigma-K factor RskA
VETNEIISSGLLETYVLGQASLQEKQLVETLRTQHSSVHEEIGEIERYMEAYAFANATPANNSVKAKLFEAINNKPLATSITATNTPAKVVSIFSARNVAAAAVVLLIGSSLFNVSYYSKVNKQNEEIAELKKEVAGDELEDKVVRSKYCLPMKMNPELAPKDADAKIYWLTNTGEIYIDPSNLPATPAGMQYQLWAIVDGKAVDAGLVVSKDGKTLKMQKMKSFGKAQAFAVTLEKAGGVIASKEKPYMIVSL